MKNDKLIGTAKVSSQGQVTLPKVVRNNLKVNNGELVIFTINDNGEIKIKNAIELELSYKESETKENGK